MLDSLRTELEAMELGPLFGLWIQSFLIQLTMTVFAAVSPMSSVRNALSVRG